MRLNLLFLFLISFSAWGLSSPLFRHELTSQTAVGAKKKWDFARTAKGYRLNGLNLAPARVSRHGESLKVLHEVYPPEETKGCPAGTYIFRTTKPGHKKIVERGCLGTARFGQLRGVFEQLAKP